MSETTFPFAPPRTLEAPAPEKPDTGKRNLLLVLGTIGIAVLLGIGAWFLFFSGDDESAGGVVPAAKAPSVAAPATDTAAKPAAPAAHPAAPVASTAGRNPFTSLLPPAAPAAPAAGAPSAPTGVVNSVTTGGAGASSVTPGGAAATLPAGAVANPTSPKPISVQVDDVAANNASVRMVIGGKNYAAAVGAKFATYFKVLRLENGTCGTFQYGNQSFRLCEGDSAVMQ